MTAIDRRSRGYAPLAGPGLERLGLSTMLLIVAAGVSAAALLLVTMVKVTTEVSDPSQPNRTAPSLSMATYGVARCADQPECGRRSPRIGLSVDVQSDEIDQLV